ncbi:MAG: putative Smr domain protein [Candidatus Midichloriaceae bacterium]|jgi:DNA-nicking Smr family endonuclease|nr:putative Smr domain protein [Candidatus Midichloriaceae bacterium]
MANSKHLSENDLLLWLNELRTVKKLSSKKNFKANQPAAKKIVIKEPDSRLELNVPKASIAPTNLDFKISRKINRGQIFIDAKLDLHGLTEMQAFDALQAFVQKSFSSSHRLVIVITGKGSKESPSVLKSKLPTWISRDSIAPFIISFSQAAKIHGGEGAFYLYLRKNKKG